MSGSRLGPYLGPLIALLVVLALGAGTVYAAIPNGSGTYYACLTKSSGVVRLINYPKVKCATGERFIKWNAKGPAGPQGVQGPQGAQGDQGPAGASGSSNWGDIANKPAGFADGVDNEGGPGYVSATQPGTYAIATVAGIKTIVADTPVGTDIELTIIPTADSAGSVLELRDEAYTRGPATYSGSYPDLAAGMLRHWYEVYNEGPTEAVSFKVRTRVYNTGIAPAAFKKALAKVRITVTKGKRSEAGQ